ncbi:MAG: thiamine phosphate synthase [Rhodocyclaceae bacterium]
MAGFDLSLYLVLDAPLCADVAGMVRTAGTAARHGATVVQLRAPQWKKGRWLEAARALKTALAPTGVPLIINDHVDIALAVDADGVHIGQDDLPPAAVRALIGPHKILGYSVSTPTEYAAALAQAQAPGACIDYLGVGPVFPTGTKPDAAPALGQTAFATLLAQHALPVVAIGGIHTGNAAALIAAGADGVAVVSAICGQADIAGATARLARIIEDARS